MKNPMRFYLELLILSIVVSLISSILPPAAADRYEAKKEKTTEELEAKAVISYRHK